MLHIVLDPWPARLEDLEPPQRLVGRKAAHFRRAHTLYGEEDETAAAGAVDLEMVSLIALLVDQDVVLRVIADFVPEQLERPVSLSKTV
jgi:hypothetical protein